MTFKELGKDIPYKHYEAYQRTISRNIKFEKDVAEELNKIKQVLRFNSNVLVGSSVIVDIGMRYFFQYLEDIGEDNAMELLVNGVLLKL